MDDARLRSWFDAYGRAWETRDPDAAAALFAAEALYRVTPFRESMRGREAIRDYWARATDTQEGVRFDFEPVALSGETGIALWQVSFRQRESRVEMDGVFLLSFDPDGRCSSLREWWHAKESG